jgi:ribosomal protein S18 acetylase RimI-like enzyme
MTHGIRLASSEQDIEHARELMRSYARWTGIDLCFQNFEAELAALPGKYSAPEGGLWLAGIDSSATPVGATNSPLVGAKNNPPVGAKNNPPVGVVAVRPLTDSTCELKRLWVEQEAKGAGLGRELARTAIAFARNAGYVDMKLDTLKNRMPAAIALYRSLGFVDSEPYTHNPEPDVLFMTLKLS